MNDRDANLNRWLKGDAQAVALVKSLFQVYHFWDDLIDRDKPLTPKDINAAMWEALVTIPQNGFYQRNFNALHPMVINGIINWHTANTFEAGDNVDLKRRAYVIRNTVTDIISTCALIIGGPAWAQQVHIEDHASEVESFDDYLQGLTLEHKEI